MNKPNHALPRLRELRLDAGMSIRQLARAAHVSTETIQRVEGGGKARASTRDAFAEALDVHPWRLVFDEDQVDRALEADEVENVLIKERLAAMSEEQLRELFRPTNPAEREAQRKIRAAIEHADAERQRHEAESTKDAS